MQLIESPFTIIIIMVNSMMVFYYMQGMEIKTMFLKLMIHTVKPSTCMLIASTLK